jgi:hypothetical protein
MNERLKELQKMYSGDNDHACTEFKDIPEDRRQELAEFLVNREVKENMSMIVQENIFNSNDDSFNDYEEVKNLFLTDEEIIENETTAPEELTEEEKQHIIEEWRDSGNDIKEVLEWWLISEWLHDKLNEKLEPVFTPNDFNYFWGRTCSGQAICLDYVIQEIAYETFIQ